MTTVYDAIKAGMDKYPEIEVGKGDTYHMPMSFGDPEVARCCAIGFMALGKCDLEFFESSPRVTKWAERALLTISNDNYKWRALSHLASLMYLVLPDDEGHDYIERESTKRTIYQWSDDYVREFVAEHDRRPTHVEFLAGLKEDNPALAAFELDLVGCDLIEELPAWTQEG